MQLAELTERERQVLPLIVAGMANKTIADKLGISERTAKYHVSRFTRSCTSPARTS